MFICDSATSLRLYVCVLVCSDLLTSVSLVQTTFAIWFHVLVSTPLSRFQPLCVPVSTPLCPGFNPSVSRFQPLCVLVSTPLCPGFNPSVSRFQPLCVPVSTPLCPGFNPSASRFQPLCVPVSTPLCPGFRRRRKRSSTNWPVASTPQPNHDPTPTSQTTTANCPSLGPTAPTPPSSPPRPAPPCVTSASPCPSPSRSRLAAAMLHTRLSVLQSCLAKPIEVKSGRYGMPAFCVSAANVRFRGYGGLVWMIPHEYILFSYGFLSKPIEVWFG